MENPVKIIRTESDAEAWLRAEGLFEGLKLVERKDGRYVVERRACRRCGGTGIYSHFHGVCWECNGVRPSWDAFIPLKDFARERKAKVNAARRAEEKAAREAAKAKCAADRWLDEHPECAAVINDESIHDNTLGDLCEQLNAYGKLSEAQAALIVTIGERHARRRAAKAEQAAISKHVGTVGKREVFTATIKAIPSWDNAYGTTFCHIMEDADGNVLVWRASNTGFSVDDVKAGIGDTVTFKATVKEHGSREGVAQTLVQRAKASEISQAATEAA